MRLDDAEALFDSADHDGAIYLAGYAVECALKACIAKQTQQYEFPDKEVVLKSYSHTLTDLVKLAGPGLNVAYDARVGADVVFNRDWILVRHWHEDDRYRSGASGGEARDFVAAVRRIVAWIQVYW